MRNRITQLRRDLQVIGDIVEIAFFDVASLLVQNLNETPIKA